jgi:hypothetical protein
MLFLVENAADSMNAAPGPEVLIAVENRGASRPARKT